MVNVANPISIYPRKLASLRGGAKPERSNPFLITFLDCFVATKVAPRNDVREFGVMLFGLAITSP